LLKFLGTQGEDIGIGRPLALPGANLERVRAATALHRAGAGAARAQEDLRRDELEQRVFARDWLSQVDPTTLTTLVPIEGPPTADGGEPIGRAPVAIQSAPLGALKWLEQLAQSDKARASVGTEEARRGAYEGLARQRELRADELEQTLPAKVRMAFANADDAS